MTGEGAFFPAYYDSIAQWYDESVRTGSLIHDLLCSDAKNSIGAQRDKDHTQAEENDAGPTRTQESEAG